MCSKECVWCLGRLDLQKGMAAALISLGLQGRPKPILSAVMAIQPLDDRKM